MPKKVYVHVETKDSNCPVSTVVIAIDRNSTVETIQDRVSSHLSTITGTLYDKSSIILTDEYGKRLAKSVTTKIDAIVEDQDVNCDFFVFTGPKLTMNKEPTPIQKNPPEKDVKKVEPVIVSSKSTPIIEAKTTTATKPNATSTTSNNNEVLEAHRKLEECMIKRQYRSCKPLAELLIQNNCGRSFAHNCLALMSVENGKLDEAIRQCKFAIDADRTNPNSYYILGKAYCQKQQFEDAIDICDKGVKVWKARAAVTPAKDRDEHLYLNMVVLQAECMFADGDHNDAANLLNSLMGNPHCDRNLNVLVTYASFALQYRKLEEAVVAFVKSIALKVSDPRVTKLAVDILTTREGFQEFQRQFPPAMPESAEVYAFLGTLVKELSAMDASVALYQIATRLQPENPSYVLNLVHVFEVKQSLDDAVDLLRAFYTKNSNMGFRLQQSSNAVALNTTCARMLEAMQPPSSSSGKRCQITWVTESAVNNNRGFAFVEQVADIQSCVETPSIAVSSSSSTSKAVAGVFTTMAAASTSSSAFSAGANSAMLTRSSSTGSEVGNDEVDEITNPSSSSTTTDSIVSTSSAMVDMSSPYNDPDHVMYTFVTRELDLIALYATTVKVYYLKGLLSQLPMMITLMERIRAMTQTPLHETLVRNELAYYQDIVQILSVRTHGALYGLPDVSFALNDPLKSSKPQWVAARQCPIYLCGDSHCLSGGWSILNVHNLPRLVIPKLVTGIKHWHLRPESKFYPKENFLQTIASIPIGSEVIFVLGEIDCREGLLSALEQGQYASLEEGMQHTINIFVKVLKDLKRSRKFRIYIHPVPPVLNETRSLVIMYNNFYRKAIQDMQDDSIVWLDFLGDLVLDNATTRLGSQMSEAELVSISISSNNRLVLREKYHHDGTHLSPLYLELIEANLNRLPPASVVTTTTTSGTTAKSTGARK